jgi:acetyl-CoA synthetase
MSDTRIFTNPAAASSVPFTWDQIAATLGAEGGVMNVGHLATAGAVARGFGGDHAFVWYGADGEVQRVTYSELDRASAKAAALFSKLGVVQGDRIFFVLPVIPELYYGYLGALRLGAIVGVLSPGRNAEVVRNVLSRSRPKVVVTLQMFNHTFADLKPDLPDVQTVLYINRTPFQLPSMEPFEKMWQEGFDAAEASAPAPATKPGDRSVLYFTELAQTGSVITHEAALGIAHTASAALDWKPREAVCVAFAPGDPLFTTYALLAPLLTGSTVVAHEDPARFTRHADVASHETPSGWLSSFRALDVMLRSDPNLGGLLKACRSIAVTYPADPGFLSMTSMSYGSPVRPVWTQRELNVIQTIDQDEKYGSVGKPISGTRIKVVDGEGKELPAGMVGTICVKTGPSAPFLEYWEDPGLTARHLQDGWFHTPARGRLHDDGSLWIGE